MSKTNKPRMTVDVYEQFPRDRRNAACHQFTLKQVKQYLSAKPLRRGQQHKAVDIPGESNRS